MSLRLQTEKGKPRKHERDGDDSQETGKGKLRKHERDGDDIQDTWMPTELLLEILVRLPFRDMVRLRLLSKAWNARLDSVYLFKVLLQQNTIDLSRCIVGLGYWPRQTTRQGFIAGDLSLQLFFPPLRTWFQLPLHPALASNLGYRLGMIEFKEQDRYIRVSLWGCHAGRGLICSMIGINHLGVLVSNYLTGKLVANVPLPPKFSCTDYYLRLSPDVSSLGDYTIILAEITDESNAYMAVYNSKLGLWRSGKGISSAVDVDTETRCFENADFVFARESFIHAYSIQSDEWYKSDLKILDEATIWSHTFIWRGKLYFADVYVDFDYDTFCDDFVDHPIEEMKGFKVFQLRTKTDGHGLCWHEISRTPAECLIDLQNVKGYQRFYMSLKNSSSVIYMAGFNDPEAAKSPADYYQHSSYAWGPISYDLESDTWSMLPSLKNDKKVLDLVQF